MKTTKWLIAVILILATVLVVTAANMYLRSPWVQVVGDSVLRSNAPAKLLADVEHAIVDRHRNYIDGPNGTKSDPSSSEGAHGWSTGPSPEKVTAKVTRGKMQITDKDGHVLSIEDIEASQAPTLIFVEFNGPDGARSIVSELLVQLEKQGVTVR